MEQSCPRAASASPLAIPSHHNPKIFLKHRPSILEHQLVASKVLGLLFGIFLEVFPMLWLLSGVSGESYIFLQVLSVSAIE